MQFLYFAAELVLIFRWILEIFVTGGRCSLHRSGSKTTTLSDENNYYYYSNNNA